MYAEFARRFQWPPDVVDGLPDDFADEVLDIATGFDLAVAEMQRREARRNAPAAQPRGPRYGAGGMGG